MKSWQLKSIKLLQKACSPHGILASLNGKDNYDSVFTRDAVMAGIAGILLNDNVIIQGLKATLEKLKELQGSQGQIASNYKVEHDIVTHVSFGTLSPKLDAATWYLVGVGLSIKTGAIQASDFTESVQHTVDLLCSIEYNGKHLLYVPKGGNWADEYHYDGYILYDQVLRVWGLSLVAEAYNNKDWMSKSKLISQTLQNNYFNHKKGYFNSSIFPGGVFDKFDLAAHALAGIIFEKNQSQYSSVLDWIAANFVDKNTFPPVFFPIVDENSKDWGGLSQYFLYRFKNKPHHFHNGGIWFIWLGWLSISLSIFNKNSVVQKLVQLTNAYLNKHSDVFDFDEYIASDDLTLHGTTSLTYTATGLVFLNMSAQGYDYSLLFPGLSATIKEPLPTRPEYFDLSKQIVRQLQTCNLMHQDKIVIGIAGESGSGKSITAKCLQQELQKQNIQATILHQDGYFKLAPKENHNKRKSNLDWVGINEVRLDLMQQHIAQFKKGESHIEVPVVDYDQNKISTTKSILVNKTVLIVEGVYSFYLTDYDYKIFMARTYKDTLEKRKSRTREVYDPFVEEILEIEHELVIKKSSQADSIVTKDYQLKPVSVI